MTIGKKHEAIEIKLEGEKLEQVTEFVYLGGLITEDAKCTKDVKRRIGLASAMFGQLRKIWKSKSITIRTKKKLYETLVIPVLLYGAECWSLKKEDERRLLVAEMGWLRGILGRSRRERIRNEITRKDMGQETTIIDRIRKRRLTWFGHVSRMENGRLPLNTLHAQIEGQRSRGRPAKTWMKNVMEDIESLGLDIREAVDMTRERQVWRRLVGASSSALA